MNHRDILDLFFSKAYEKQLNMNILDDVDYVIPVDGILNYVCEVINVSYKEYIEYINDFPNISKIESVHLTQSSSFSACEREMVDALLREDNRGFDYVGIGQLFTQYVKSANTGSYRKYGENQAKTAWQLGLLFEHFGYWYLNCVGYLYNDLPEDDKNAFLARAILRDPLYNKILRDLQSHDIDIVSYMSCLPSNETKYRRYDSIKRLIDICLKECALENIPMHKVLDTKTQLGELVKADKLQKKIKKALEKYNNESHTNSLNLFHELQITNVANDSEIHDIGYYIKLFKSLHRNKCAGKYAPYKPVLLLTIIKLIEMGEIVENKIYPSPILKRTYASTLQEYVIDETFRNKSFTTPYIHMDHEDFWLVKYKEIPYSELPLKSLSIKDIDYTYFDSSLFNLLLIPALREQLKHTLLDYFEDSHD